VSVEEGGREGGADTELKTKTPHVNVGNEIDRCKHTTPEAYNSLQKVLEKEGKYKIKIHSYT